MIAYLGMYRGNALVSRITQLRWMIISGIGIHKDRSRSDSERLDEVPPSSLLSPVASLASFARAWQLKCGACSRAGIRGLTGVFVQRCTRLFYPSQPSDLDPSEE